MPNIAVLDFESNGSSTSTGRIISASAILYSDKFEELDRFELFCRNVPGYIPDPYSLWVNKGLKKLKETNMSHYQLMLEMHKYINKWSPCIWTTWNGMSFDFPLAEKENYKSLLPIYILKLKGNEAADFLPFARAAKLFYPDCLETTYSKSNNPVFKLEDLGMKNFPNTDKSKFHTATQDCEITAKVITKVKEKAKDIFNASFSTTSKKKAKDFMLKNKLFTTVLYYFGKSRPFACTYFFDHPVYSGWPVVFCLENDPKDLILLDYKSLKERMKKPGKFIRNVPLKNPVLLNINYSMKFSPFDIIGLEKINERADVIKNNPEFIERCKRAIIEIIDEKLKLSNEDPIIANDPHNQLYSTKYEFIKDNSHSGKLMKEFHLIDWDKRYEHVLKFKDKRLKYFGERLIYQNKPEALPKEVYNTIHVETAERVLRLEEKNFTTIPMAEHLIDSIRAEKDITKEKLDYINEVDAMIKEMRVIYEKALVLRTDLSKRAYGLEQAEKQRIEAEKFSKLFDHDTPKENAFTKKNKKDIA